MMGRPSNMTVDIYAAAQEVLIKDNLNPKKAKEVLEKRFPNLVISMTTLSLIRYGKYILPVHLQKEAEKKGIPFNVNKNTNKSREKLTVLLDDKVRRNDEIHKLTDKELLKRLHYAPARDAMKIQELVHIKESAVAASEKMKSPLISPFSNLDPRIIFQIANINFNELIPKPGKELISGKEPIPEEKSIRAGEFEELEGIFEEQKPGAVEAV